MTEERKQKKKIRLSMQCLRLIITHENVPVSNLALKSFYRRSVFKEINLEIHSLSISPNRVN